MERSRQILIYEDDAVFGYALAAILRRAGYTVETATAFPQALDLLEGSQSPDLLIADLVFPTGQVSGLAMARMARFKRPGMKVIYMTGHDVPGADTEALGPILRKPISDDVLLAEVARLFGEFV